MGSYFDVHEVPSALIKVIFVYPMVIVSLWFNTFFWTFSWFTLVPVLLPRSSKVIFPYLYSSEACLRDTVGSLILIVQPPPLPIMTASWFTPNLTFAPGQKPGKGAEDILNREPQPVPLPEGQLLNGRQRKRACLARAQLPACDATKDSEDTCYR